MEVLFKVNDDSKLGKVLLEIIRTFQKQDKDCVQLASDKEKNEFDNLIFAGKRLTDTDLEKLTVAMEEETEYHTLSESKKLTLDAIRKATRETGNKKESNE